MAFWISGFATFYTVDCLVDYVRHQRRADLVRILIGSAIAALNLAMGIAA